MDRILSLLKLDAKKLESLFQVLQLAIVGQKMEEITLTMVI